ncbi:MAG: hypothetical protein AABY28_05795, partial [Candidatus Omnitrophota bacterium]
LKDAQDKLLQKDAQLRELNSLKDALARQLQEANTNLTALTKANNSLQKQVEKAGLSRKSLILRQKKLELDSALKEKAALQEELMARNQEYQDLQTELNLARQQQKKIIGELNKAATLNTSLQQSFLVGLAQTMAQEEEDKEKAREFKNKVELILTPQREGKQ